MKAVRAKVTNYRSIDDSGWVDLSDVTCLVGKNESGKTTFIKAIEKINPVDPADGNFNILDYPRKGYTLYKRKHETEPAIVVEVEFELTDKQFAKIELDFGKGFLSGKTLIVKKNYKNELKIDIARNEASLVKSELLTSGLPEEIKTVAAKAANLDALYKALTELPDKPPSVDSFIEKTKAKFPNGAWSQLWNEYLVAYLPKFFYFDDYSTMRGQMSIHHLRRIVAQNNLTSADKTFMALLQLVGASLDDFAQESNYEHLKAELEAASIKITDEVFEFWSQNKQLEVEFDISQADPEAEPPLNIGTILHVRIKNNRHRVSVSFDERSKGFVWFFSFLAYFSQLEDKGQLILLLDEPGLSLHAKAQEDFLRFIEHRLAPKHQVIYTTHSPFLIDPRRLDRVRTVQDVDGKGTVISGDVLKNDSETVYPLQAALGYDISQTLFIAPNCVLVEGASDIIYLQVASGILADAKKEALDEKWVIIPVGGADKLTSFVTLIGGNKLNVVVLLDITAKDKQRIDALLANSLLQQKKLLNIGMFTGASDADIEDVFEPKLYLEIVNGAYEDVLTAKIKESDISQGNPRIAKRLEQYFKDNNINGGKFSHYRPAAYLLRNLTKFSKKFDANTLARFEAVFKKVNTLLT